MTALLSFAASSNPHAIFFMVYLQCIQIYIQIYIYDIILRNHKFPFHRKIKLLQFGGKLYMTNGQQ